MCRFLFSYKHSLGAMVVLITFLLLNCHTGYTENNRLLTRLTDETGKTDRQSQRYRRRNKIYLPGRAADRDTLPAAQRQQRALPVRPRRKNSPAA